MKSGKMKGMAERVLKKWKEAIKQLGNPKDQPTDFQCLVLTAMKNGMTVRDASRVFGLTEQTLFNWRNKYTKFSGIDDKSYFMLRAYKLGADDEVIAKWFGLQRIDQVASMIAKAEQDQR